MRWASVLIEKIADKPLDAGEHVVGGLRQQNGFKSELLAGLDRARERHRRSMGFA
jgi:hypothetical protein